MEFSYEGVVWLKIVCTGVRWGLSCLALAAGIRFLPELRALPFLVGALLLLPFPPLVSLLDRVRLRGWKIAALALLLLVFGLYLAWPQLSGSPVLSRAAVELPTEVTVEEKDYVLSLRSMKIHRPDCTSVETIAPYNRQTFHGTIAALENLGYEPCQRCKPD